MIDTTFLVIIAILAILLILSIIATTIVRIVDLIIYRNELVKQKLKELEQLKEKEKND